MPDRELSDVILKGLVARRLPEFNERVRQLVQDTLCDLGASASETAILKITMQRIQDEDPSLYQAWVEIAMEAAIVAEAIDAGCTVDADGTIHPPA